MNTSTPNPTQTPKPAQRLHGLENSKIPCKWFCPKCNHALDENYTTVSHYPLTVTHNRCRTVVVDNPDYAVWQESQTDDFSDLLKDCCS